MMSKAVKTWVHILAVTWLLRVAAQNVNQSIQTIKIRPNDCGRLRLHSDSPGRATYVVAVQLSHLVRTSDCACWFAADKQTQLFPAASTVCL
jgi:hypothetical protein